MLLSVDKIILVIFTKASAVWLLLPDLKVDKDLFYFQKGNDERVRLIQEERDKAIAEKREAEPEVGVYFSEFDKGVMEDVLVT